MRKALTPRDHLLLQKVILSIKTGRFAAVRWLFGTFESSSSKSTLFGPDVHKGEATEGCKDPGDHHR